MWGVILVLPLESARCGFLLGPEAGGTTVGSRQRPLSRTRTGQPLSWPPPRAAARAPISVAWKCDSCVGAWGDDVLPV